MPQQKKTAKKTGLKSVLIESFKGAGGLHIAVIRPNPPKVSKATYGRRKKAEPARRTS